MAQSANFEDEIKELKRRVESLNLFGKDKKDKEIASLSRKLEKLREKVYSSLTPWQIVQVARHPERPYTLDYIQAIMTDFIELHGDRRFAEDPSLICGFARLGERSICIIGHQKGRNAKERAYRNFGMPRPEGYRKSVRVMRLAEKFKMPIITFIDTPGAFPGIDAEERGQAEAIAYSLRQMSKLSVPIIVTITGEGGSGGALAIAVGDRINMLEFSIYSVISPEGCASILWKDAAKAELAAEALKLTSRDLLELKIIDRIIQEPIGGAHADPTALFASVKSFLMDDLNELSSLKPDELLKMRYEKFRRMGVFEELPHVTDS